MDGINVINWVIPGSFETFAAKVHPVLRERVLAQSEYSPGTLREKLFGDGPLLHDRQPAAACRGAFATGPSSWEEAEAKRGLDAPRGGVDS